jgi:beta-glucosidase
VKLNQTETWFSVTSVSFVVQKTVQTHNGMRFRPAALCATLATPALAQQPAFLNTSLPFEQRAADLVSRLTLEEKVQQMKDVAPAIERLGVPAYNWWNEALHGVARSGLATVFPQAIGFAATWNDSLVFRMASVISDEARAKHHEYVRNGSFGRYQGLTFWSPNINIFRDPRWGRGQETYGEDPFLTGKLAVQFIRGLQGDDPKYFKTVATVKHFAVHSGPEPERHTFDAVVSERDLRETYLPHFEMGTREGGAYSLMCAYNRVDGKPACGSDMLLGNILRGEWKFPGYIVSDCGAIDDIFLRHKVVQTAPEAASLAVKTGTDLDCGRVYPSLADAVKQGLITEAQIDTSLTRLFLARFKLGMFDPPEMVRWAQTPFSVLDQSSNRELARQVARESIVLLKNDRGVLPLRKDLGTLAVIGPNADQWRMLLGNYNGIPSDPVTPLRGIREAVSRRTRVLYARGSDLADGFPLLETIPSSAMRTPTGGRGLQGAYFGNRSLEGTPVFTRTDTTVEVDWHEGAPRQSMNPNDFGVRWTGTIRPPVGGMYRLGVTTTMRAEVALDDSVIVRTTYPQRENEFPDPRLAQSEAIRLEAGRSYRVRVEAHESYGEAELELVWSTPTAGLEAEAVAAAKQADAVVMFLGLTARLEGEEMSVAIDGFRGGDRTAIDLPAAQQRLLERVVAVAKPTVLVLLNGSALAVNWAQANVPAIVEAWYPGQAGNAIADVLFGDYNPAGRLPITFYESVNDIPAFDDYRVTGRTYRFFKGEPLYPFGHGLSYTSFSYANLKTSAEAAGPTDTVMVSVDVTNSGKRAGDEVVQMYVEHVGSSVDRPIRDLRGYRRLTLAPGETKAVQLPLAISSLAYWDESGHRWVVEPDQIRIRVGASSADLRLTRTIQVTAVR